MITKLFMIFLCLMITQSKTIHYHYHYDSPISNNHKICLERKKTAPYTCMKRITKTTTTTTYGSPKPRF